MYLGIPNNEDTLSTVGGPCHFDYKSFKYEHPDACAICVTGIICLYILENNVYLDYSCRKIHICNHLKK